MNNIEFELGYDCRRYGWSLPLDAAKDFIDGFHAAANASRVSPDVFDKKLFSIRQRAYKKKRVCTLVKADLEKAYKLSKGKCQVLGVKLTFNNQSMDSWSIDRIDNSKGYLPDNICVISAFVNECKKSMDFDQMTDMFLQKFVSSNPNIGL